MAGDVLSLAMFCFDKHQAEQANLIPEKEWFEDARDFLNKLVLIGTNKNPLPPRQPQEFSRVILNWEIWGGERPKLYLLLAPTGALIVTVIYYSN